jgi:hypothetical protein
MFMHLSLSRNHLSHLLRKELSFHGRVVICVRWGCRPRSLGNLGSSEDVVNSKSSMDSWTTRSGGGIATREFKLCCCFQTSSRVESG